MVLDERTLRAAGLPATLISLLVSITKAAERAQAAANTAAATYDLSPQISAAVQVLEEMGVVPGLGEQIAVLSQKVDSISAPENALINIEFENGHLILVMGDGTRITGPKVSDPVNDPEIVLTGGALVLDGPDLVIIPPVASVQGGVDLVAIYEQAKQ